jgi:hypothetical protein
MERRFMAEQILWSWSDGGESVSVMELIIVGVTVLALLMSIFIRLTGRLLKFDILSPSYITH